MSSTKIINVLKDDSFQEILDLFKGTDAGEVIFVLPKRSKAFQKEEHFQTLKAEATDLNKAVSFLCSNPEVNEMAKKFKFDVLLARASAPTRSLKPTPAAAAKKSNSINIVNQIEDFYSEPASDSNMVSTAKSVNIQPEEREEEKEELLFEPEPVRKVNDVVVPSKEEATEVAVTGKKEKPEPVIVRTTKYHPSASVTHSWLKVPPGRKTALTVLACAAVVVLGTVVFISTGSAKVSITPASTPLDFSINVLASDAVSSVDSTNLAIPGQVFNISKTVSQDFPATGHVDVAQKARGQITLYNKQSSAQPLVATTRLQSSDGHIFHTLASVTVPANGQVNVQVIADKAGQDYNVAAGKFTVPAFQEKGDTQKFQQVYGQSTAAMTGGANGQSTVITSDNETTATQTLTSQVISDIQDELKSQAGDLKILNSDQVNVGATNAAPLTDPNAQTFTASLQGSIKTVGFKESDLDSLIQQYVDSKQGRTIVPDKLTISYGSASWDGTKNGLVFSVHVTGPGYAKIDQNQLIGALLGKNSTEIKQYLGSLSAIASAKVSLSPFWVTSVPKNQNRVKLNLTY